MMKNKFKLFLAAAALIGTTASAQLVDEKDVSITVLYKVSGGVDNPKIVSLALSLYLFVFLSLST
jgi:hypothetical protein